MKFSLKSTPQYLNLLFNVFNKTKQLNIYIERSNELSFDTNKTLEVKIPDFMRENIKEYAIRQDVDANLRPEQYKLLNMEEKPYCTMNIEKISPIYKINPDAITKWYSSPIETYEIVELVIYTSNFKNDVYNKIQ